MSRLHRTRGHDSRSSDIFGAARRAQLKAEHDAGLSFRTYKDDKFDQSAVAPLGFCERKDDGTFELIQKAGLQYTLSGRIYETNKDGVINIVNSDYLKERVYAARDKRDRLLSMLNIVLEMADDEEGLEALLGKAIYDIMVAVAHQVIFL